MSPRTALILGVTGQDGSYLAELLLSKGYRVHGLARHASVDNTARIQHLLNNSDRAAGDFTLYRGDITDSGCLRRLMDACQPSEVYNLAAQSHVHVSFAQPEYTARVTGLGALRVLEATRDHGDRTGRMPRLYQASTSEIFGRSEPPQSIDTPLRPMSPYACAKAYAHWQTINYRESYGIFAVNGVLFNHESPRRGTNFVTRKITSAAAQIRLGRQQRLALGNLDVHRDWGHARDYVVAMWQMLQTERPSDYVIATGVTRSVRDFAELAFAKHGLDYQNFVDFDPQMVRPSEPAAQCGDATPALRELGWKPTIDFAALVDEMATHDLNRAQRQPMSDDA